MKRADEAKAAGQPVREDDDPEVFKTRLAAYNRDTAVVAPITRSSASSKTIDGMQPIDEVTDAIAKAIGGQGRGLAGTSR